MDRMKYRRIMLKLSGEALAKPGGHGLNHAVLLDVAKSIKAVVNEEIQVVVVVGGGNIWRFRDTTESGIERTASDALGMLATIMNSVGLRPRSGGGQAREAVRVPDVPGSDRETAPGDGPVGVQPLPGTASPHPCLQFRRPRESAEGGAGEEGGDVGT